MQMSAVKTRVYFAGPLFTQAEWRWNAEVAADLRVRGFEISLPQERAALMLSGKEAFDPSALFAHNVSEIDRADVVLAVFDGADSDSGTCWECGYAFHAKHPIVGLRTDIRAGGDDAKMPINLMLSQSCAKLILVPLGKRDDIGWVGEQLAQAIQAVAEKK